MAPTQLDIIRRQGEAAARNEAARAAAAVRRETSLVGQANRLLGEAARRGEAAARQLRSGQAGLRRDPGQATVPAEPPAVYPAPDGYVRRSPVQPVHEAAGYRQRLIKRAAGALVALAIAGVALYFVLHMGLLGQ